MAARHVFLSDDWVAALGQVAQRLFEDAAPKPVRSVTYVERCADAPWRREDGKLAGYVLAVSNTGVSVRSGVAGDEDADCVVDVDYVFGLSTLRVRSGPEFAELGRRGFETGAMTMSGSLEGLTLDLNGLHDAMCDRTQLTT